jgi:hypothetical protein
MGLVNCTNRYLHHVNYCYSLLLEELKLHASRLRRHRLDKIFLTQVCLGFKFCLSVLVIVGLRVPARYIRDFAMFNVCSSSKNCPSANVCRDFDVFGAMNVPLNQIIK